MRIVGKKFTAGIILFAMILGSGILTPKGVPALVNCSKDKTLLWVPLCETRQEWTGEYKIIDRKVPKIVSQPYLCVKKEIVPGTGIWREENRRVPPYQAYRPKDQWLDKVITIARTVLTPVTEWVSKVKTWFERTWLGKLLKRVKTVFEPVTRWIQKTIWDKIVTKVRETVMEPYEVYNYEPVKVWVPVQTRPVPATCYQDEMVLVSDPIKQKVMKTVTEVLWQTTCVDLRGIRAYAVQEMFLRLPECDSLEDRMDEIARTWRRFLDGVTAYPYANVNAGYRDAFKIFLDGVGNSEYSNYRRAMFPMLRNGFGQGRGPWEDFTADGANAAQYFRLRELAQEWGWEDSKLKYDEYTETHKNLCGELAVIAAVGDTIPQGLTIFKDQVTGYISVCLEWRNKKCIKSEIVETGAGVLRKNALTNTGFLMNFFKQYENWGAATQDGDLTAEDLASYLRQWRAVIPLVELQTTTNAGLLGLEGRITGHWVLVLQVLRTNAGDYAVRVYNSFNNLEEYYTWESFEGAWSLAEGTLLRVVGGAQPRDWDYSRPPPQ